MKVNDLLRAQRKPSRQRDTIVFSEAARKAYVTGFKKRKDERREVARKEIEKKARTAKIVARREKREALAFALSGGIAHRTADEEPEETAPKPARKALSTKRQVFEDTLTTTTVTQLVDSSDPTFELHAEESSEAVAARLAAQRAAQQLKRAAEADKRAKMRAQKAKGGSKGGGGAKKPKATKSGKNGKGKRAEKGGRKSAGTKGSRGRK